MLLPKVMSAVPTLVRAVAAGIYSPRSVHALVVERSVVWEDPVSWATSQFGELPLGDVRRTDRVVTLVAAWAVRPALSLSKLFDRKYDWEAGYALLRHDEVTPDALQVGHREQTLAAMQAPGTYLLPEDSTALSWARTQPIPDLGPVSTTGHKGQGFLLHSVLALRWPEDAGTVRRPVVTVLGLADQQYHVRPPHGSTAARPPESTLWRAATARIGPPPPGVRWVRVCDREGDAYPFLQELQQAGYGFVVRLAQDRLVVDAAGQPLDEKVKAQVRAAPSLGGFTLEVRQQDDRSGKGKKVRRPEPVAHLQLSATPVRLRAPKARRAARGGEQAHPPLEVTIVRVWEPDPPPGVEPLEWLLICDQPVTTFEEALVCAQQYATRWLVEEFHKALKTGTRAEDLQLESGHALMNAVALKSVIAVRLLHLKEIARLQPEAPATTSGLDDLELAVLETRLGRPLPTVRLVLWGLARLGGYFGTPGTKQPPGWLTLSRGLEDLLLLAQGARMVPLLRKFQE